MTDYPATKLAKAAARSIASIPTGFPFWNGAPKMEPKTAYFTCPSCAGNSYDVRLRDGGGREMIRCLGCEVEMFWPIPSSGELTSYYTSRNSFTDIGDGDVRRYLDDPSFFRNLAASHDQRFKSLGIAPGARILELGCMHGMLSIELRRIGYDAWGVEPSQDGIKFLNEHGGQGYCGTIFDDDCPVQSCDVAMSHHVFEHLPDPYAAFRKLHAMMPPGGVLHFAVPHWGGLVARKMQARWKWFTYPEHLHYFSERSLLNALKSMGFRVVNCETTAGHHEVDELFDALEIGAAARTQEAREVATYALKSGSLGEELIVTATRN